MIHKNIFMWTLILTMLIGVSPLHAEAIVCVHDASKDLCFICDASLRDAGRLWCKEHNRYEDRCFSCHPDLRDTTRAFCEEHALYEDECFLCRPELKVTSKSTAVAAIVEAKCAEHGAPTSLCFICDASLREKGRLWCEEHNRYEDRCFECHPESQEKDRAYCAEHFLYEDECFLCSPELKSKERSEATPSAPGLNCNEHHVPEQECGICHPDLAGGLRPGEGLKVRFASADAPAQAGVRTTQTKVGPSAQGIEVLAELKFDQNKYARIVAPVSGILRAVNAYLGCMAAERGILARIWSAEIGEAVTRAVLAKQTVERERKLRADRISSERELQEAEAAHQATYQSLRSLGFEDDEIAALGTDQSRVAELPVRSPFAGEIVERNAVRGAMVEAGQPLFAVADRSTMWAMLTIPEEHVPRVRVGQKVEVRIDGSAESVVMGTLTWIAAQVDERTRMINARAELPNPDGRLRDGMFVHCRVLTGATERSTLVPSSSIQHIDGKTFVFVRIAGDLYEARRVELGTRYNGEVEILAGLQDHDEVAIEHSFLLKSQFLISRLGAGCVD